METRNIIIGAVAVMAVVIAFTLVFRTPAEGPKGGVDTSYDSGSPIVDTSGDTADDLIQVVAKLNQTVVVGPLSLTVLDVIEDSRCPSSVQCIQAGRIRASVQVESTAGRTIHEVESSANFAAGGYAVTLVEVTPYPENPGTITDADYAFRFIANPL